MELVVEERRKSRRRRILLVAILLLAAWLAAGHFLVRPALRRWLADTFQGEPRVAFAVLWPHLTVTAFGVEVEAEHHRLAASRVSLGVSPWALFGGRLVRWVDIGSLDADFDQGARLDLFTPDDEEGEVAGPDADLDPPRLPVLTFDAPRLGLTEPDGGRLEAFFAERVTVEQSGERIFALRAEPGELAYIPFERLTARLIPGAGHVVLGNLKLYAFNGVVGGFVDVDSERAGAVNGELEWHLVEVDRVWRTYGLPYAEKRRGELSGSMVFQGESFTLPALRGKGSLELKRADYYSPLSFKVFLVLKVPAASEAPLNRAHMTFSFEQAVAYVEQAQAFASGFDLKCRGLLTFDGEVDFEVRHAGTTVAVRGPLEDPNVKVLPLDYVTLPFDRLFRQRIGRK